MYANTTLLAPAPTVATDSGVPAPDDGYDCLREVLEQAAEQASAGKGKDRHADDKPFAEQPLFKITDSVGLGFPLGQAMKKIQEAGMFVGREQPVAAINELLGAIVYIAAAILYIKKQ